MSERIAPVLHVEGLGIETIDGREIVDEVAFDLLPGRILALVGESGCGKTTTALALLAHARTGTRIMRGTVGLEGSDLLSLPPRALRRLRGSRITYVPQDPGSGLNPRQQIGRQIAEVLTVHGSPRASARSAARAMVERVRLPNDEKFLARYPFELSGGQQQRVAIAMALASNPAVVVLDEPTTGLDVTTQARVLGLLRELGHESGAAFVYVTHDLAVVNELADHVAVMYAGRIVESGSQSEVFQRPAHPYTRLLLSSVPRLRSRRELTGISGIAPPPGFRPQGCAFAPRCPRVVEKCYELFPPATQVGQDWSVRCWRPETRDTPSVSLRPLLPGKNGQDPQPALEIRNLSASYGRGSRQQVVLRGVSLAVSEGECLALVGESGSGKTTLGRCVSGLHQPDSGSIAARGRTLAPSAAERSLADLQAIQIIFQNPNRSLNPSETVAEAIARPLRRFDPRRRSSETRAAVSDLLERVRLSTTYLDRYPRQLSGGEKQRVAIARALAAQPSVLICDEITSALDVSIQAAIVRLLDELRSDGLALLFITHNLALVTSIANEVVVLEAGEVREQGETRQVIEQPSHPYTRQLVAAAPDLSN